MMDQTRQVESARHNRPI